MYGQSSSGRPQKMIFGDNYKSVGKSKTSWKFAYVDRVPLALVISTGHHFVMESHTEEHNRADTKKSKGGSADDIPMI